MAPRRIAATASLILLTLWTWSAGQTPTDAPPTIFEGARLIVGDGSPPIEDSAFLIAKSKVVAVGRKGQLRTPAGARKIDLSGKTVMPAIIDGHVHPGYRKGLGFTADNYTRENLLDTLDRFAYYGIAAVLEAGTGRGALPFAVRQETPRGALYRTAGRGIAMPNAGPGVPMRDAPFGVKTIDEARSAVRELAAQRVDLVKIWVDDRNGTVEKLRPDLYRAIIDEAHKSRLRVMAHIAKLDDAKDLLRAGVDGFAHQVRDKDVDNELLEMLKQRPQVFFMATLWSERRALYQGTPAWLDEPAMIGALSPEDVKLLSDSFSSNAVTAESREGVERLLRNVSVLGRAGVTLALGTDAGGVSGGQYFGLAAQVEMELLTKAGLTPAEVIVVATRNSARVLGLDAFGTIEPGKSADFLVLDASPLENIANTRKISNVYLRGAEIDRSSLRTRWKGAAAH